MSGTQGITIAASIPVTRRREPISENVVIGKDILELLTGAMYADRLTVYREYIQNAVDSIEDAVEANMYSRSVEPGIEVHIDRKERTIRIRDNGIGVSRANFLKRLTSIGASSKRGSKRRGFRGVGRLAQLGFWGGLVFRSKAALAPQ